MQGESCRDSKTERIKKALSTFAFKEYLPPKGKDEEEKYTVENGLHQQRIFQREKRLTNLYNMLLFIDIVLLYLYYGNDGTASLASNVWLPISYSVHIYSIFILALLFRLQYESISHNHKCKFNLSLSIFRVLLNFALHPAPWINQATFEITYDDYDYNNYSIPLKINYVLILLAWVKTILHLFVKMLVNTRFVGPRSRRVKRIYTVHSIDELFAFRCIFVQNPIRLVLGFYAIGYAFFSFAFKITESGVPVDGNPFTYFQNCLWLTFITNTTVGYGDIRIFTHIGYIVGVCCMIWGTLVISCIVVVLINTLSLNSKEVEALTCINRVEGLLQYHQLCKEYIRVSLWRLWKNHKKGGHQRSSSTERKLRARLSKMRCLNRSYNPTTNIVELAQLQFDNAKINTEYLCSNNIYIIDFISNHIFKEIGPSKTAIDSPKQQTSQTPHATHNHNLQIHKRTYTPIKVQDLESISEAKLN